MKREYVGIAVFAWLYIVIGIPMTAIGIHLQISPPQADLMQPGERVFGLFVGIATIAIGLLMLWKIRRDTATPKRPNLGVIIGGRSD